MKLNPLLVVAAIVYFAAGLLLIFAPAEIMAAIGAGSSEEGSSVAQLLGAALFGLGSLDWFQRYADVRGILGRPTLLANLGFVTIGFLASLSAVRHGGGRPFFVAAAALGLLTAAFGLRLFGVSRKRKNRSNGVSSSDPSTAETPTSVANEHRADG